MRQENILLSSQTENEASESSSSINSASLNNGDFKNGLMGSKPPKSSPKQVQTLQLGSPLEI